MVLSLCSGVLIVIFLSANIGFSDGFSNGYVYKEGNFRLLHQHPNLKSCTAAVLQNNEYVGGRVSNLTGECQGLPYEWALNQTIQSGYAYAKKRMVREVFKPPLKIGWSGFKWNIPGLFQKGTKLEVNCTMPSVSNLRVYMSLLDEADEKHIVHLNIYNGFLVVDEYISSWLSPTAWLDAIDYSELSTNSKVKISFESEEHFIKILLDDTVVHKHYHVTPVDAVRKFHFSAEGTENGATLSSLMYTNE